MNTAILNTDDCSAGFVGSQKWDDDGQGQKQDKQEPAQRIEQKGRCQSQPRFGGNVGKARCWCRFQVLR